MQGQSAIIMDMRLGIKVSKFVSMPSTKWLSQVFGPQSNLAQCETIKAPPRLEVFFWKPPAPWNRFKLICSLSGQQYKQVCGNRKSFEQCAGKWNLLALVFGPEARKNQDECRLLMDSSDLSNSNHHDLGFKLQNTHVFNRSNMPKLAEESNKP